MKIPILIMAALGLVCGKSVQNGSLQDDLNDYFALFPTDNVLEITMDYLYNDKEVQEFFAYMQSEEFPMIRKFVEYFKGYKDCVKYTDYDVIDFYAIFNEYHDSLGYAPFQPTNNTRTGAGIYGLFYDLIAALRIKEFKALYYQKKETSELYKALDQVFQSSEYTNFMNTVRTLPEWKVLHNILLEKGVEVNYNNERIKEFFGLFRRETHSFHEDVYDFMTHFPTEKMLEIFQYYLYNDKEVQRFFVYLQSEEFPRIHTVVEYLKEYKYCLKFIDYHGVDVYTMAKEIHYTLGYPPFQPTYNTYTGAGMHGFLDDVFGALAVKESQAPYYQKKEKSELYKALDQVIRSSEYMNFVYTLETLPEMKLVRNNLLEKGVDMDYYMERIKQFFGVSRRGISSLQDDLNDYFALFPTDNVLEITMDYLYNDKEVQEFFAYMQSEEFPMIRKFVEYFKGYKDCVKYTDYDVIDFYAIFNEYHDSLGYAPFQPTNNTRTGAGIYGLFYDLIAALRIKEFKALYYQKKETSELYKALDQVFQSSEYTNFMNTVRTLPEWKVLHNILLEKGVEVNYNNERIKEFFGLFRRETHSFHEDVYDFMTHFPTEKMLEIFQYYLYNDKEVQRFFVYLQSEEFPRIHTVVEYLKEYKYCLKFIDYHGVDVYTMAKEIHYTLGYPPFQPTYNTYTGAGMHGFLDDVFGALAVKESQAPYYQKKEKSEIYKALDQVIRSPEYTYFGDHMQTSPEGEEMRHFLQEWGVDVDHVYKLLRALFFQPRL